MSTRALTRRLRAFGRGAALPIGETIHVPVAHPDRILTLAFVRMGGESTPWGVGLGRPGGARQFFTVPEPRNRDLLAAMLENVAHPLLAHLTAGAGSDGLSDHCQIWVPNESHVEMLHCLALRYVFARRGEPTRIQNLNQLGRAANWLFLESQRPGQTALVTATQALREAFAFPADDLRQQHLGFLLSWLDERVDVTTRRSRALAAEQFSVSTSLEPEVERKRLEELVDRWNKLRRAGDAGPEARQREGSIREVLTGELSRRLDLVDQAITRLSLDERRINAGVEELVIQSIGRLKQDIAAIQHGPVEVGGRRLFVPSPETDRQPRAAAHRFFEMEEAHDALVSLLIHDDADLQADAIAEGDAFSGMITSVVDTRKGRGHETDWIVDGDDVGPLRLREGARVCIAGCVKREARLISVENRPTGGRRFTLHITEGKRKCQGVKGEWPAAHESSQEGRAVTFVQTYPSQIHLMRRMALGRKGTPGDWVHGLGRTPTREAPGDEADE